MINKPSAVAYKAKTYRQSGIDHDNLGNYREKDGYIMVLGLAACRED